MSLKPSVGELHFKTTDGGNILMILFCHIYSPVKLYTLDSSTVAVGFHFRLRRKVLGIRCREAVEIENRKRFGQKE